MNKSISVFVLVLDQFQETFDRHLPLWESHGGKIYAVCPVGRRVATKHSVLEFESAGPNGYSMFLRTLKMVTTACTLNTYYYAFYEYDSFSITSEIPMNLGLWGNTFLNNANVKGWQNNFVTWQYLNFPWIIDHSSLCQLAMTACKYHNIQEGGYVDRWVSAIAQCAGVPMTRFSPRGFSRSVIETEDHEELEDVIRLGGTLFHGVKTQENLDLIRGFRKKHHPHKECL